VEKIMVATIACANQMRHETTIVAADERTSEFAGGRSPLCRIRAEAGAEKRPLLRPGFLASLLRSLAAVAV
jgi:hypothetical protein